jgi:hypothetical protein
MVKSLHFVLSMVLVSFVWCTISENTTSLVFDQPHLYHFRRQAQTLVGKVVELRLINADTDQPIVTLVDGTIVNIAKQNTTNFNIEAITDAGTVGSIRFSYNGLDNFRVESERPFAFCGDGSPIGNYKPCLNLVVGQHNVSATAYSGAKQQGTVGNTITVTFSFIQELGCSVPKVRSIVYLLFTFSLFFHSLKVVSYCW